MEWTTAPIAYRCGLCNARIEPGVRFAVLTMHRKTRCAACALASDARDADLPLTPTHSSFEDLAALIDDQQSEARRLLRLVTSSNGEPRACPSCGRIMSEREAREQGACTACRPELDIEVDADAR